MVIDHVMNVFTYEDEFAVLIALNLETNKIEELNPYSSSELWDSSSTNGRSVILTNDNSQSGMAKVSDSRVGLAIRIWV